MVGEHLHPALHESFSVEQGELTVLRDGRRSTLRAGERVDIEPCVWHDWWNEGAVPAVVRVEVTPGERFVHLLETLFGLARGGYVNARGMPKPLQLALTATEFSDVFVLRKPPAVGPARRASVRSRPSPAAAAIARRTRRCRARPSPHARQPTAQRAEPGARRHAGSTYRGFHHAKQRTTSAGAR